MFLCTVWFIKIVIISCNTTKHPSHILANSLFCAFVSSKKTNSNECAQYNYVNYIMQKRPRRYWTMLGSNIIFISLQSNSEWGWTARNSIARQSFAGHFWQQINCSTRNWSTARIQLILAQLDLNKWQKSDK
jgi:hypothetical protein